MRANKKGFTIIELLVVIAVIAILTSVTLALFGGPKAKSRDARREQDTKEIHKALSLYINQNGSYPVCATTVTAGATDDTCFAPLLIDAKFMTAAPRDPMQSGTCSGSLPASPPSTDVHAYCYISNGTTFVLYYNRETGDNNPIGWNFITP